jgi:hypothetical protein
MAVTFGKKWYLFHHGRRYGPITDDKLRGLVEAGHIKQDDYLWCSDFSNWRRFGNISDPASLTAPSEARFRLLRGFNRILSRRVLAKHVSVFKKIAKIVSRPSEFADRFIRDGESSAVFESMKFYGEVVAITLVIVFIGQHFTFVEGGHSEARELSELSLYFFCFWSQAIASPWMG